jgi:hypothetical protein
MNKNKLLIALFIIPFIALNTHCDDQISNPIEMTSQEVCYQKLGNDSHWQIFTDNRFGTDSKNISNNPSDNAYGPIWSPDGKFIAFRYDRSGDTGADTYLYDVNNDTTLNITSELISTESATPKFWSSDSRRILYYYHKIGENYYYGLMDYNGTNKQLLFIADDVKIIAFCDLGGSILYTKGQLLYKYNIATLSSEQVLNFNNFGNYSIYVDDYNESSNTILCHEDSSRSSSGATFLIKEINLSTGKMDTLVTAEKGIILLRRIYSNHYSKIAYITRDYTNDISKILLLENGKKTELNELTETNLSYATYGIEFSPQDNYITFTVNNILVNETVSYEHTVYIIDINNTQTYLIKEAIDSHWNPLINF